MDLVTAVAGSVYSFLKFYQAALTLRLYLTWFPVINLYSEPFYNLIKFTNPYIHLWRGALPAFGPIDLSPLMGFLFMASIQDVFAKFAGIG